MLIESVCEGRFAYFFSVAGDRLEDERRLRLLSFFERECDRERR